jgi:zinc D-Ala-D-Ala carboxypeptidase
MRTAAAADRVTLQLVSGFRSIERQTEIVLRKIRAGALLEEVLQVNAYPGFSEHHTGRALDIGSPHCAHLTEAFASTPEFTWLERHADEFGFRLSYPRNNALGLIFEPWHWCFGASVNSGEPAPADCRDP